MPLKLTDADRLSVLEHLKEIGCCKFCAERFSGERYYDNYKKFEELAAALSDVSNGESEPQNQKSTEEPSPKRPKLATEVISESASIDNACQDELSGKCDLFSKKDGVNSANDTGCVACYGLLEIQHLKSSFKQIVAAVKESGCVFSKFTFQLSVPVTLELRHHAMVTHLKEKFRESYKECSDIEFVSAKEVWNGVPIAKRRGGVRVSAEEVPRILSKPTAEKAPTSESCTNAHQTDRPKVESKVEVSCVHSPIYLAGRYCKYSRLLSQTPWILNGKRIMEASVQELITDVVTKHIPNEKIMFSSSGREDVDVRMLGRGRPFVLEIFKAKRAVFTTFRHGDY
ncbi:hypothetical protein MRX96_024187 [Rhipicephalus microplus]